ncbi:MAG TPA: S41 family peptidase [Rhizomicrobium sp.]|nr:S41 family peptidase [Rhizomicrobium sp.]
MKRSAALAFCAVLFTASASAQQSFDPKPWLDDLTQMHTALMTRYANIEWLITDRGADLDEYFSRTQKRIAGAQDAGGARNAFDMLARRIGDGHIDIEWPQPSKPNAAGPSAHDACAEAGYDATKFGSPLAALMPGYEAIRSVSFPAGVIAVGEKRIGILKLGLFSAEGIPQLCHAALVALKIAPDAPCDDKCQERIAKEAEARMNDDFIATLETLNTAHIDALLIDLTGNGGGSEWAEAAARMVTSVRLKSERIAFVRGAQWSKEFADAEKDLRAAAKTASQKDRVLLLNLAALAKAKRAIAGTTCGKPDCVLAEGFYASGFLDAADPRSLEGKSWGPEVFTPMEHPYREGIWRGPLLVLVDGETWSAAEEFAAVLQDNHAATIIGEPTGGAGCGHTDGSEPVTLTNSGAKLSLPDCARLRADGTNEVRGIIPDIALRWGHHDGPMLRAQTLLKALPATLEKTQ